MREMMLCPFRHWEPPPVWHWADPWRGHSVSCRPHPWRASTSSAIWAIIQFSYRRTAPFIICHQTECMLPWELLLGKGKFTQLHSSKLFHCPLAEPGTAHPGHMGMPSGKGSSITESPGRLCKAEMLAFHAESSPERAIHRHLCTLVLQKELWYFL